MELNKNFNNNYENEVIINNYDNNIQQQRINVSKLVDLFNKSSSNQKNETKNDLDDDKIKNKLNRNFHIHKSPTPTTGTNATTAFSNVCKTTRHNNNNNNPFPITQTHTQTQLSPSTTTPQINKTHFIKTMNTSLIDSALKHTTKKQTKMAHNETQQQQSINNNNTSTTNTSTTTTSDTNTSTITNQIDINNNNKLKFLNKYSAINCDVNPADIRQRQLVIDEVKLKFNRGNLHKIENNDNDPAENKSSPSVQNKVNNIGDNCLVEPSPQPPTGTEGTLNEIQRNDVGDELNKNLAVKPVSSSTDKLSDQLIAIRHEPDSSNASVYGDSNMEDDDSLQSEDDDDDYDSKEYTTNTTPTSSTSKETVKDVSTTNSLTIYDNSRHFDSNNNNANETSEQQSYEYVLNSLPQIQTESFDDDEKCVFDHDTNTNNDENTNTNENYCQKFMKIIFCMD